MFQFGQKSVLIGAVTLLQLTVIVSSISQTNESINVNNQQNLGTEQPNGTLTDTNERSMESQQLSRTKSQEKPQQARSGRMMDLDHLVGAIGKDEKVARERSINGNRQSRILSEDIQPASVNNEARSKKTNKKSGGKKMAIKGFIPIVSLEGHKGGNPLDEDENDDEESESGGEENHNNNNPTSHDQLLSGYGGHTSMGHASFVGSASEANPQQQQSQQQWQHLNSQVDQPDAARARKLLHINSNMGASGLLNGLSAGPKRLISTLVPGQQQQPFVGHSQMLQGPMNMPQYQTPFDQLGGTECMCVPFFQCRNGYLSANQLSRSQLQQISAPTSPLMMGFPSIQHQQQQSQHMHQIPRALKSGNDLYYSNQVASMDNQQHQQQYGIQGTQTGAGLSPTQPDDQQTLSDAYEQLKKTMESENIEQLLLQQQQQQQQMMNLPLLDERSKAGNQQTERSTSSSNNNSSATGETQERSLLNPLAGRRSSSQQKSCGIMRTCCKIPPGIVGGLNRAQQAARLLQQQQQDFPQQIPKAQQFYPRPQTASPMIGQPEQSFQGQSQPHLADYQSATTALSPSVQSQFQHQHQQQQSASGPPMGSFMAGRCGTRQALGVAGRVQNVQPAPGSETTAEFGEFPSHAAILKRLSPGDSLFVCSATLISNQWLATAAHCIKRHRPDELKVRLGEWDVQRDDEFYPFVELNVRDIIIHPDFQPSSLINDLALLRLESPLDPHQMPHIAPACLATPQEVFARSRCWLTGWGKDAFGQAGSFQSILKKVDLPVMDRHQCESALRYQTKLGKFFRLHQSGLCAGGERGKDACEGDGGSGLYCTDPESGLTKVIGLVSWGVGCGQVGVPGVYTNVGLFYPWIEGVISSSGEENLYMDRNSQQAGGNSIPDNVFKSLVSERSNQAAASTNATLHSVDNSNNSTLTIDDEQVESRAGR